jgi:CheY-like chemotaxis protein
MLRIMLVEDNGADARLTKEVLKDTGLEHEVIWVNEGKKAIDHLASDGSIDLFILDLHLPKASGLEVLSAIRMAERYRSAPVIVMSGSIAPSDRNLGNDPLLFRMVKPMTIEEIDQTVMEIRRIVENMKR